MNKFFDRKCPQCGSEIIDSYEPSEPPTVLCLDCGEPTERMWKKSANVIGDEMDAVITHGSKTPWRCRSRADYRNFLKQKHLRVNDTHVRPDDYKSRGREEQRKFSGGSASSGLSQDYMDGVAQMLARVEKESAKHWRDANKAPIGITSDEGVIRYLGDQRRAERGEFGFSDR